MIYKNLLFTVAALLSPLASAKGKPTWSCVGIWQPAENVPLIGICPTMIVARPALGPAEVRHLVRVGEDRCEYEEISSDPRLGNSRQILCIRTEN